MERLRSTPPSALGGLDVLGVDDLAEGSDDLPPTDGLRFRLADGARVVVRPSGTEPKVKCYLEVVVPVEDASDNPDQTDAVEAARISAATRLDALAPTFAPPPASEPAVRAAPPAGRGGAPAPSRDPVRRQATPPRGDWRVPREPLSRHALRNSSDSVHFGAQLRVPFELVF